MSSLVDELFKPRIQNGSKVHVRTVIITRLRRIVEIGEENKDYAADEKTLFDMFVENHPEWAAGNSFVVILN